MRQRDKRGRPETDHICTLCGRDYHSRIGLFNHTATGRCSRTTNQGATPQSFETKRCQYSTCLNAINVNEAANNRKNYFVHLFCPFVLNSFKRIILIRFGNLTANVFWRFGYIGVCYISFVMNSYLNSVSETPISFWKNTKNSNIRTGVNGLFEIWNCEGFYDYNYFGSAKGKKKKSRIAQTIYQQFAVLRLAKLALFRWKMLLIVINTIEKFEIQRECRNI